MGTAAALVPIQSIVHQSRGDKFTYATAKEAGPICQRLYTELRSLQRGDSENRPDWRYEVKQTNTAHKDDPVAGASTWSVPSLFSATLKHFGLI